MSAQAARAKSATPVAHTSPCTTTTTITTSSSSHGVGSALPATRQLLSPGPESLHRARAAGCRPNHSRQPWSSPPRCCCAAAGRGPGASAPRRRRRHRAAVGHAHLDVARARHPLDNRRLWQARAAGARVRRVGGTLQVRACVRACTRGRGRAGGAAPTAPPPPLPPRRTIPWLAERGYKVYAVDLLGQGGSAKPQLPYTMEASAQSGRTRRQQRGRRAPPRERQH